MKSRFKKVIIISLVTGATLFHGAGNLMATELNQEDGIFPWHSTEYIRTLNRNASTDADAAFYNPAGLAFMKQTGLYINFSNNMMYKNKYSYMNFHDLDIQASALSIDISTPTDNIEADFVTDLARGDVDSDNSYIATVKAPAMPDFNIIYKADRWAAYLSIGIMQAAPEVDFRRGLITADWGNLCVAEQLNAISNKLLSSLYLGTSNFDSYTTQKNSVIRTEYYVAGTLGAAYRIIDMLSASAGFRYIYYMGNQKVQIEGVDTGFSGTFLNAGGSVTNMLYTMNSSEWDLDTSYKGQSYGLIFGLDFKPTNDLNIGIRYEYYLPAELKKKTNSFVINPLLESTGAVDIFKDGTPNDDFNGGLGYYHGNGSSVLKVTYPQSVSTGISYQLSKDWRVETGCDVYFRPYVDLDGREKNFNIAYRVGGAVEYSLSDAMVISAGYSYHDTGVKNEYRTEIDSLLNNHSIGTGFGYKISDRLSMNAGLVYIYYVTAVVESDAAAKAHMLLNLSSLGLGTIDAEVDSTSHITRKLAEDTIMASVGVTYRLWGNDSVKEDSDADDEKVSKKKEKKAKKEKKEKKAE
ncbi:MAG TPA: outer membrane protein transport protein [Spirochaetota bacterium]|nr:outer membrane protein transport protein [Spirochaetota bacterium]